MLNFNLFNTQWGTNFPQWIGGDLRYRFRLIPHPGDWREAKAWIHGAAAIQPPACLAVDTAIAAVRSPVPRGILMTPREDLETVVFKRAESGEGFILRLRDPDRPRGAARYPVEDPGRLHGSPHGGPLLTHRERDTLHPARTSRGGISLGLELRPFEVVTLKLVP